MPNTNYLTNSTELAAVADAIRAKGGTSEQLAFPDGFATAIGEIETGGGGAVVKTDTVAPGETITNPNLDLPDYFNIDEETITDNNVCYCIIKWLDGGPNEACICVAAGQYGQLSLSFESGAYTVEATLAKSGRPTTVKLSLDNVWQIVAGQAQAQNVTEDVESVTFVSMSVN